MDVLRYSAELHVPLRYKNYYKFWWSEKLSFLKDKAVSSNKMWKDAGRPRTGPIADLRNAGKRKYERMSKHKRQEETQCYANDLHDALMCKSDTKFWKCLNLKFEKVNKCCKYIDGIADDVQIAEAFAELLFGKVTCTLKM